MRLKSVIIGGLAFTVLLGSEPLLRGQVATSIAPAYRVVDLGVIPGGADDSYAQYINDVGQVVGTSGPSGKPATFMWDPINGLRDLAIPSSGGVNVCGINNQGIVVGRRWNSWAVAFQWDAVNGTRPVGPGPIAGYPYYGASAINDHNEIAFGNWSFNGEPSKAYLVSGANTTWIGEIYPNASFTEVWAMNNHAEMAGSCIKHLYPPRGPEQAFYWKPGQPMVALGFIAGCTNSRATAINDASQVVGYSFGVTNAAFIWSSGEGMSGLECSSIAGWSATAFGISAGGIAVGSCVIGDTDNAIAWGPGRTAVNLNSLVTNKSGWAQLDRSLGINASGCIVGSGTRTNNVRHAFILYPTAAFPLTIVSQPQNQRSCRGQAASLSVVVTNGLPPYKYQWYKDNSPILGATNSVLALTNLQVTNTGDYAVQVTDLAGSTTNTQSAALAVDLVCVSIALYAGVTIDGDIGQTYGVQMTFDLSQASSWVGVTNLTLTIPKQIWYDSQPATLPQRYYRVVPGTIVIP